MTKEEEDIVKPVIVVTLVVTMFSTVKANGPNKTMGPYLCKGDEQEEEEEQELELVTR